MIWIVAYFEVHCMMKSHPQKCISLTMGKLILTLEKTFSTLWQLMLIVECTWTIKCPFPFKVPCLKMTWTNIAIFMLPLSLRSSQSKSQVCFLEISVLLKQPKLLLEKKLSTILVSYNRQISFLELTVVINLQLYNNY